MFQNEISDKLHYFAQQGMDLEVGITSLSRKRRRSRGSRIPLSETSVKNQQLKLF